MAIATLTKRAHRLCGSSWRALGRLGASGRSKSQIGAWGVLLLAFAFFSCSTTEPAAPPEPSRPTLPGTRGYLLISLDTLRADHLGSYGHSRDTSPFLDSLAARGALFENAYAQLPGTLPSHMSIFTGLYPAQHGVYPPNGVLSKEIKTLPELLFADGFKTAGHTEGGYVHGTYGFDRGFGEFSDEAYEVECDIERTLNRGMDFLERVGPEERFFLFLHTYVVHDPYPDVRSIEAYHFPMKTYREPYWPGDPPAGAVEPTGPNLEEMNRQGTAPGEEALDYFRAVYDAQIRYLDDLLREFFQKLDELGLTDELTVIITSDHGEEFAEHGRMLHDQIYRETLHVPLIVVHPGVESGRRIPELVQSIDIAPTILDLAGVEPPSPMSGQSLVSLLVDQEPEPQVPVEGSGEESQSLASEPKPPRQAFAEGVESAERTILWQTEEGVHQLVWSPRNLQEQDHWMSRELTFDTFAQKLEFKIQSFHRPRYLELEVNGKPFPGLGRELNKETGRAWISRQAAFEYPGEQVWLLLSSFHRPRWVEIFVGEEKLSEIPKVSVAPGQSTAGVTTDARPGEARIETRPVTVEFTLPPGSSRELSLRSDSCDSPVSLGKSEDSRCLGFQILEVKGLKRLREVASKVEVKTERRTVRLFLPADGKKRVTFIPDSCDVPAKLGPSDDPRCLSFRLDLPGIWHIELFNNDQDPAQASDLSGQRSDLSRPMLHAMSEYRFEPVAPAGEAELPPELEERLRALGYLN